MSLCHSVSNCIHGRERFELLNNTIFYNHFVFKTLIEIQKYLCRYIVLMFFFSVQTFRTVLSLRIVLLRTWKFISHSFYGGGQIKRKAFFMTKMSKCS